MNNPDKKKVPIYFYYLTISKQMESRTILNMTLSKLKNLFQIFWNMFWIKS